mmetsp:Transcript_25253/g.37255  ORF Transcript_25253/g.37255 Transcript_25253/m.37255 type:complete len:321 (-) Transcript_25253:5-967(-)
MPFGSEEIWPTLIAVNVNWRKNESGSSSSSRENGSDNNERDNTNGNETDDKAIDSEAEGPVGSEIWELIDKFLQQRKEYLPQLKQQIHWNEIFAEASSRRDHFISTSSEEQQQQQASLFRAPSLTPRNLAFSAVKRRSLSTPNSHMNLSLTPLTSNRNTMSNINSHELSEVTIPSWNFISRMVQQRQDTCTKSCDAFRSEPFLQSLLDEAKARCKVLEVSLQALKKKNELEADIDHNRNKRGSTTPSSPEAKRVKFDNFEDKCVTGISFFKRSEPIPKPFDHDECSQAKYSDSIMQTQIKLNLWLSLSKSVEKIIDVGNK